MKVTVKEGIKGFSGKLDGAIYYYHPRLKRTLMRKKPQMPVQEQNVQYKNISQQIKALDPSVAYRYDFKVYLSLLQDKDDSINLPSWYSLFTKMLWAMQKKYPANVHLLTLTREQILAENLPCRSVKAAVADGLLPEVTNWELLDRDI
jgi:hypothetical protein